MRNCRFPCVCVAWAVLFGSTARASEEEVRQTLTAYVDAFNTQNVEGLAGMLAENAVHTERESGVRTEGRAAIQADLTAAFKNSPNMRLSGRVDRVRLIQPTVAQADGETLVVGAVDPEPVNSRFTAILVKGDAGWKIDSIEESPIPSPITPYEALRELEWLVGGWTDRTDGVEVETTFRWAANQAFLLRSYVVRTADGTERQGTQVIGWDPRSLEIRSWSFNADGSFGDGVWSRNGHEWLIRSSQTLADGRAASGTYVMTRVDDGTVTMQLIGHEIEGEPQPSSDVVTMVRTPDAETSGTPDAKSPNRETGS